MCSWPVFHGFIVDHHVVVALISIFSAHVSQCLRMVAMISCVEEGKRRKEEMRDSILNGRDTSGR